MRLSTPSLHEGKLRLGTSRSGSPFLSYSGRHLNSPYDPMREAARFAEQANPPHEPTVCLILGDTLPYLRTILEGRYPAARVLSIFYDSRFPDIVRRGFAVPPPGSYWHPGASQNLRSFLDERLSEIDIQGLTVYVWPPSKSAFPAVHEQVAATVEQAARELTGGWAATAAFHRVWLHNLITNYLSLDTAYVLRNHHRPVVIAASGPSLRDGIPLVRRYRDRVHLVALPSSLEALSAGGVPPDLVVSVDGGYWADSHLRGLKTHADTAIAFPLIASRGVTKHSARQVVLSAGSYIERELFARAGLRVREIAATGTVAATALELTLSHSDGPVIFAGLDLCYDGLFEHVRPHSFDPLFEIQSKRDTPMLTVLADRIHRFGGSGFSNRSATGSPAMRTYAGWFRSSARNSRVYRLFPSRIRIDGMQPLDASSFGRILKTSAGDRPPNNLERVATSSPVQRRSTIKDLLASWQTLLTSALAAPAAAEAQLGVDESGPVSALIAALDPRGYLRYRGTPRDLVASQRTAAAARLVENAIDELSWLKHRYLS